MLVFPMCLIKREIVYPLPLFLNYRSCTNTETEPNEYMSTGSPHIIQPNLKRLQAQWPIELVSRRTGLLLTL